MLLYETEANTNKNAKAKKGMSARADFKTESPDLLKTDVEFDNLVKEGAIEENLRDLVAIGASQLNGCAFCVNPLCLRKASVLLPDRFSRKSFLTTSMNEDCPS